MYIRHVGAVAEGRLQCLLGFLMAALRAKDTSKISECFRWVDADRTPEQTLLVLPVQIAQQSFPTVSQQQGTEAPQNDLSLTLLIITTTTTTATTISTTDSTGSSCFQRPGTTTTPTIIGTFPRGTGAAATDADDG